MTATATAPASGGASVSAPSSCAAAPMYGDLVGRWIAAKQGRSFKCLVLDLDNTVWGGVIGDDGMEGIALGQGSPLGEAYVAFQDYARELSHGGADLSLCDPRVVAARSQANEQDL